MTQRFEGRNVEEALGAAAEAFGVERYRVTHRVLVEKRGFLGGIKRVVIEAEVNENAEPPRQDAPAAPVAATPRPASAPARESRGPARERGGRPRRERGAQGDGRRERPRRGRGGDRDRGDGDRGLRPGDFSRFAGDVPQQAPESEGAAAVRRWCEELLDLANLDMVVRTTENDERIEVKLYGIDSRRFLDRNGELLDAAQVLANKALVGRKLEKEIELDCEAFKQRREEDLERRAREVADLVRADGVEQLLPAMSPIERRIVHVALQDDSDVTTESRGDGFYKRVAIIPRGSAAGTPEP